MFVRKLETKDKYVEAYVASWIDMINNVYETGETESRGLRSLVD